MKQGRGQEAGHDYELVSCPGDPPPAKYLEGAYNEIPYQPLSAIPPAEATPTPGSVGRAEEEAVYGHIPGDQ